MKTIDCQPATLVSGGKYRTQVGILHKTVKLLSNFRCWLGQNGLFPYTINSITSEESKEKISTLVYNGQVLERCTETEAKVAGGANEDDFELGVRTPAFKGTLD